MAPRSTVSSPKPSKLAAVAAAGAAAAAKAKAAAPTPTKRPAPEDEETVPAKTPKVGKDSAPLVKKPVIPSGDNKDLGSRDVMRNIVPWVLQELPGYLVKTGFLKNASEPLQDLAPLRIDGGGGGGVGTSFKQHWEKDNCLLSMQKSGLYEAGGSLFWVNPDIAGKTTAIPSEDPPWHSVLANATNSFAPFVPNGGQVKRIRFPIDLACYMPDVGGSPTRLQALGKTFPKGIMLLGGHSFIYSWYVGAFLAMERDDSQVAFWMYECALTTTIRLFSGLDQRDMALESMRMSEHVKQTSQVMVDSFITFASKVDMMVQKTGDKKALALNDLIELEVRFDGSLINTSMWKTLGGMKMITPRARELFSSIDRNFGMGVLTGSYNKLKCLFQSCSKVGPPGLEWCVESMLVTLLRKEATVDDFKCDAFNKSRDGSPPWMATALMTRTIVEHLGTVAEGLAKVDPQLAAKLQDEVIEKMNSPLAYHKTFPATDDAFDAGDGEGVAADVGESGASGDFLESLASKLPRGGVILGEVMKKVYDQSYSDSIVALCSDPDAAKTLSKPDEVPDPLGKDLRDLLRALHAGDNVVSADVGGSGGPPKMSLRELVRQHSDGAEGEAAAAERADVWKRAVQRRKSLVTLGLLKDPRNTTSYSELLKKSGAAANFVGKVGEEHRLFVWSADLCTQNGKEPWSAVSVPDEKIMTAALTFIKGCRGVADVSAAFDGCNRKARFDLDSVMMELPACSEVFVVYTNAWNSWIKRKQFLASETREVGFIALPTSRGKLGVQDRGDGFNGAGESSSHYTSFTGVECMSRLTLPRIGIPDKKKIFSDTPDHAPAKWSENVPAGVPLFWQETKSSALWTQLLQELSIKCVVDMSPGSGSLGVACMEVGATYFGMCTNNAHLQWLGNVLDRAALKFICGTGSFLYREDLAGHVREVFAEHLEEEEYNDEAIQLSDEES